jgi:phasin family protein
MGFMLQRNIRFAASHIPPFKEFAMFATPDQLLAAHKANVDTALTVATTVFGSAERLVALNLNAARNVLDDSIATTKALLAAKDPQEVLSIQGSLAQPALERAVAYARNVYEISTQTNEELAKLVEAQYAEGNKTVVATLDKLSKNAPAGSEVAVAAVKSALAAANSAYDSMSKAARQVAEVTEANVTAATSATVKAMNTAQPAAKSRKAA